jgi:maleate isomerase
MSLIEAAASPTHFGTVDLGLLPSELDGGVAWRAAIGLIVLATDQTMEHEFRILVRQPGVAFYESRVFNDHDITPETLRAIGARIAERGPYPPERRARCRGVRLHIGDHNSR